MLKKQNKASPAEKKPHRRFLNKPKKKVKNEMRLYNQRRLDSIFLGGMLLVVGSAVAVVLLGLNRQLRPAQAVTKVIERQGSYRDTDKRLEQFLEAYIASYFTYSGDSEAAMSEIERLNSFYNAVPEMKSQGQTRLPSQLIASRLVSIKDNVAVYKVTYETGLDEKSRVTVHFGIPYGEKDNRFYVSGLPYFEAATDLKAENVSKKTVLMLSAKDNLEESDRDKLDSFVKLFFTNYTTDQENLDLIAKDVRAIKGVTFKTLDYSYYKKKNNQLIAYVQVTFDILGTSHSENFTLTLDGKNSSYYVSTMEHQIPINYDK